jgi:hypothetical protein
VLGPLSGCSRRARHSGASVPFHAKLLSLTVILQAHHLVNTGVFVVMSLWTENTLIFVLFPYIQYSICSLHVSRGTKEVK